MENIFIILGILGITGVIYAFVSMIVSAIDRNTQAIISHEDSINISTTRICSRLEKNNKKEVS